jgi:iron complex transport system permease protein
MKTAALVSIVVVLFLAGLALSIGTGTRPIDAVTVLTALFWPDAADESHAVVRDVRLPRAVASAIVGAALAVAGAVLQGLTRNPIASPSVLGISSGSSLAMILARSAGLSLSAGGILAVAVAGAAGATLLVFGLASMSPHGGPVRLALAGAGVTALLGSVAHGVIIAQGLAHDALSWFGRGVQNVGWSDVAVLAGAALVGLAIAVVVAPALTVLALGDDAARGLGQRRAAVLVAGGSAALLLTGASVSIAGTIPFVGLMVPHLARAWVGVDYRRVVPLCAVLGAALLLYADLLARFLAVSGGSPIPVGLVTTVLGTPFLLVIVRRMRLVD